MLVAVLFAAYVSGQESSTPVPILRQINRVNDDGSYTFGFEAADGTFKIETRDEKGNVKGKYGYLDETGELKVVEYSAGKDAGFTASGAHLPESVPALPAPAAPVAPAPAVRAPVTTTAAPVTPAPVRAPPALPAQTFQEQFPQQFPQQFNQPQFNSQQFPQQFAPQQFGSQQFPQQFAPQQFAPQQFAPQQFAPQQFPQQFNSQQFPQQFAPQQFNSQQFAPQQFAPQQPQVAPQVSNSLDDGQRQNRGFSFSFSAPVNSQQPSFPQQQQPFAQQFNQFPVSVNAPRFQK